MFIHGPARPEVQQVDAICTASMPRDRQTQILRRPGLPRLPWPRARPVQATSMPRVGARDVLNVKNRRFTISIDTRVLAPSFGGGHHPRTWDPTTIDYCGRASRNRECCTQSIHALVVRQWTLYFNLPAPLAELLSGRGGGVRHSPCCDYFTVKYRTYYTSG